MRSEDYIVIQGWMRSLGLTDKQLLVYAMIWGFSRDGRSRMRGSAKYIAAAAGCKVRNAQNIIRQLEDLGLISHEVVATRRGLVSEFWALLPQDIAAPEKGSKEKITWSGKRIGLRNPVTSGNALPGYASQCVTPIPLSSHSTGSNNKKIRGCCKNGAPAGAKTTTTTTGFLFENNESGLPAGKSAEVEPPFQEEFFLKEWRRLLEFWSEKSSAAISVIADKLKETGEASSAAYCCRLAVEREWDTIADPTAIIQKDIEQVIEYEKNLKWQGYDV